MTRLGYAAYSIILLVIAKTIRNTHRDSILEFQDKREITFKDDVSKKVIRLI